MLPFPSPLKERGTIGVRLINISFNRQKRGSQVVLTTPGHKKGVAELTRLPPKKAQKKAKVSLYQQDTFACN